MPIVQFDLDGTLTLPYQGRPSNRIGTYAVAEPDSYARTLCNDAHERGWTVTICTGRGEIYRAATEAWLRQHDFRYHFLFMDKLSYDVVIDDLARTKDEFREIVDGRRKLPIEEPAPLIEQLHTAMKDVSPQTIELDEAEGRLKKVSDDATRAMLARMPRRPREPKGPAA